MAEVIKDATMCNIPFWVCLIVSIALIVSGFLVPPTGEIDGSVLKAVGELLGFATLYVAFIAMKKGIDFRLQHGKTSITAGDLNDRPDDKPYDNVEIEQ